jgi:surfeit locus 1 family protein
MSPRAASALLAVATVAAIALFVAAGNWQRGRMNAKEAEGAALAAAKAQKIVPLPATDDWSAWRYRRVTASGLWQPSMQYLVDNRIVDGRAGFGVVAGVALDDGRYLLVDRGWVPAGAGESRVPKVPPLSGRTVVRGRVVIPPQRYLELEQAGPAGDVWQNLDPKRIAAHAKVPFLPIVVEQAPGGRDDGLVRRLADPASGATTHRIYMWQWYAFAALAAGLWVYYALVRPRRAKP